jgi:excisionase family DNA binding protein
MTSRRDLITLRQAAEWVGVDPTTLRRWIAKGKLPAYRIAGTRNLRLDRAEVEALLLPIPTAKRTQGH